MERKDKQRQRQEMHDRGICVVIPTYNNERTIATVVAEVKEECSDIIVVNDGSTDSTPQILNGIDGVTLITSTHNEGKGHALRRGLLRAKEQGFHYAITIDADGQHFPNDIPRFVEANSRWPQAIILGSRRMEGVRQSRGSRFANRFSNFWFFVQTGRRLADTQTGFRLYPLRRLKGIRWMTARYEAELLLLVLAAWSGVAIRTIDIPVFYPPQQQRVSHFRPGHDFARISVLNTVLCILAIVYGWPRTLFRFLASAALTVYTALFFLASCAIITPAVWLYTKTGTMTEKKRQRLHLLIYRWMRFVVLRHGIPGVTFSCHRHEKADFKAPAVIIANHQSHLDLACQLIFTPNIVFLTNRREWNHTLYGLLIRQAEFYPVTLGIDALLPRLRSLVQRGYSIGIYPEATRSEDCRIGRFHKGAFHISEQLDLPVIPIYLYGPGQVLPKNDCLLRPGRIHVEVGKPISREQLTAMGDIRTQASLMRKHYEKKLWEFSVK